MTLQNQEALLKVILRQNLDATVGQFIVAVKQQEWLSQDFAKQENVRILNSTGAIKMAK